MSTQAKVVRVVVTSGLVLAVLHPAVAGDVKLLGQPGTFPIVITVPGSYRLKSNLTVPDANTSAIDVEANDVALDLNGYVISGPVTCTGTPVTSCTPSGSGFGIVHLNPSFGNNVRVTNGTVRGMGDDGIRLADAAHVERVTVTNNGNNGILASTNATIIDCTALSNGNSGIAAANSSTMTRNHAEGNKGAGINASFDTIVSENTVWANAVGISSLDGTVVQNNTARGNANYGIGASGTSTVNGNTAQGNSGFGLLLAGAVPPGYWGNIVNFNNGGNANPQVSGGTQIGTNICGGDTVCP